MLNTSDFIHIDFTKQMTQAGIAYAIQTLITRRDFQASRTFEQLRIGIVDIAVELAFRRHLTAHRIPYVSQIDKPFTKPDRQGVFIGGRKCEIIGHLISHRDTINNIRKDNNHLLQAPVNISVTLFDTENLVDKDLLIFAFATGLITETQDELKRAQSASQPTYFIHLPPTFWSQPLRRGSLGRLVIRAEDNDPILVEVVGSGETQEILSEQLYLEPQREITTQAVFNSLNLISIIQGNNAKLKIFCPKIKKAYHIAKNDWTNIWVYGMDITLIGFITLGEFKHVARPLKAREKFNHITDYPLNGVALPTKRLHPLADLFQSALKWSRND